MSSQLPAGTAVRVEGISKRYRIGDRVDRDDSLVASFVRQLAAPVRNYRRLRGLRRFEGDDSGANVIWALRDVSFELAPGDVLGVVGRNGAGKSTLLKVLARITEPTEGRVDLRGRVASLLEVGTGFHPDLTGRENVFLNGTMLGMSRREVASRLDEILAFAEIEQFADTPVKRYSSGMYVRLAFSVAAHVDPDVLIADEVLSVGDAEFQRKSIGEMRSVAEGGRTVIFVSHNHALVSSLCNRAIWLEEGCVRAHGDVDEVMSAYASSQSFHDPGDLRHRTDRTGSGAVRIVGVALRDAAGDAVRSVKAGRPISIEVTYEVAKGVSATKLDISLTLETLTREKIATVSNTMVGQTLKVAPSGRLTCRLEDFPLNEGDYMCTVRLEADGVRSDFIADTTRFHVDPTSFYPSRSHPSAASGVVLLRHDWSDDGA